jgi:hypothetical protein
MLSVEPATRSSAPRCVFTACRPFGRTLSPYPGKANATGPKQESGNTAVSSRPAGVLR